MLYVNSSVGFNDVVDGTTTTFMIGDSYFGFWGDADSCCVGGATAADRAAAGEPVIGDSLTGGTWISASNGNRRFSFGSTHNGATCFAMVDGQYQDHRSHHRPECVSCFDDPQRREISAIRSSDPSPNRSVQS